MGSEKSSGGGDSASASDPLTVGTDLHSGGYIHDIIF